eukprot:1155865-Pelagomonas_calceolata.AAC.1
MGSFSGETRQTEKEILTAPSFFLHAAASLPGAVVVPASKMLLSLESALLRSVIVECEVQVHMQREGIKASVNKCKDKCKGASAPCVSLFAWHEKPGSMREELVQKPSVKRLMNQFEQL